VKIIYIRAAIIVATVTEFVDAHVTAPVTATVWPLPGMSNAAGTRTERSNKLKAVSFKHASNVVLQFRAAFSNAAI